MRTVLLRLLGVYSVILSCSSTMAERAFERRLSRPDQPLRSLCSPGVLENTRAQRNAEELKPHEGEGRRLDTARGSKPTCTLDDSPDVRKGGGATCRPLSDLQSGVCLSLSPCDLLAEIHAPAVFQKSGFIEALSR